MHSRTRRFLHVANGTCTTRLIEAAGIPGTRSIWADPLYEGPVPGDLTDDELVDVRSRHLARGRPPDPRNDLRAWRAILARHAAYDEVVLWFEHDLFDQLNLVQLLDWIGSHLPATMPVSLVCVGSFPGHPRFKGLGELEAGDLASLMATRQPMGNTHRRLAEQAWQAFRSGTPEALSDLLRADTRALPFLAAAMTRLLQELPWTTDGLSRTERSLLRLAEVAPVDLGSACPRIHEGEDAYYVTDRSLADMGASLAATTPPLVTVVMAGPDRSGDAGPLHGTVDLTDVGRAVLASAVDRVATCGIDRWLGGTHLQGRANVWRWDDARRRVGRH